MNVALARWAVFCAGVAGSLGVAASAPRLLRRIDGLDVRRVAVVGTVHMAPHEVLAASGIRKGASLFDDSEQWLAPLRKHPLVADVRAERQLPDMVVLTVTEAEPIAWALTPELRPVSAAARVLPIDPARAGLDLPLIVRPTGIGEDGYLSDPAAAGLASALAAIRRDDPWVAVKVSEIHPWTDGGIRLVLREPAGADALFAEAPDAARLRLLRLALADLAARGDLARLRRADLRYAEQTVVSLAPPTAAN